MSIIFRLACLLLLAAHIKCDLTIASNIDDDEALFLEGNDLQPLDGTGADKDDVLLPKSSAPTRERPPCSLSKAREGDVEAQYWCGWALNVSGRAFPCTRITRPALLPLYASFHPFCVAVGMSQSCLMLVARQGWFQCG